MIKIEKVEELEWIGKGERFSSNILEAKLIQMCLDKNIPLENIGWKRHELQRMH